MAFFLFVLFCFVLMCCILNSVWYLEMYKCIFSTDFIKLIKYLNWGRYDTYLQVHSQFALVDNKVISSWCFIDREKTSYVLALHYWRWAWHWLNSGHCRKLDWPKKRDKFETWESESWRWVNQDWTIWKANRIVLSWLLRTFSNFRASYSCAVELISAVTNVGMTPEKEC